MVKFGDSVNKVIVVLGPTAVGKTKMSVELAKKLNGEVINADSTQIFKELNIATAKIKEEEKEGIVHHLFDIKDKEEDYTVYDYQKDCRRIINEILKRGKTPILVGGTGLYIKAALYNYEFDEMINHNNYSSFTNEEIYNQLLEIDPNTCIHINNRKRIEHALDYYKCTGKIIGNIKSDKLLYDAIFIGLTTDRETLYQRINKRVDVMVNEGLIEEAKEVYKSNIRTKAVLTPIGYKELFLYFDNKITKEEALDKIRQNSRRYAKRQYTWFNNQMNVTWFNVDFDNFDNTIYEVLDYIKKRETN